MILVLNIPRRSLSNDPSVFLYVSSVSIPCVISLGHTFSRVSFPFLITSSCLGHEDFGVFRFTCTC